MAHALWLNTPDGQTYADVSDGFKSAASGKGTLLDALTSGQQSTIDTMKAQSIPVKG